MKQIKFWSTPDGIWLLELVIWIYCMVGPVIISVHGNDSMAAYPFYAKITDVAFVDEITPIVMVIFHMTVLLPMCAYVAECSFASSSRVPSGPRSMRD